MTISLNGEPHEAPSGSSLGDLIAELGLRSGRFAIELNRDIIPRSQHDETVLREGDTVEIVHAIGGG
ncbi:MAG: sulfur carrier protein ThiS [Pseudomonadota bacterium]